MHYPSEIDERCTSVYVRQLAAEIAMGGGTLLLVTQYGAHLYGTSTAESDEDYAILYLPDLRDVVFGRARESYRSSSNLTSEKNGAGDVDVQAHALGPVLRRFLGGEIVAFDLLHAITNEEAVIYAHPEYRRFVEEEILSRRIRPSLGRVSGFIGYINHQASKYGVKGTRLGAVVHLWKLLKDADEATVGEFVERYGDELDRRYVYPTKVGAMLPGGVPGKVKALEVLGRKVAYNRPLTDLYVVVDKIITKYGNRAKQAMRNEGVDYKAISHAFRAAYEYLAYVRSGFQFPFSPSQRKFMRDIKEGRIPFTELQPNLERTIKKVLDAVEAHRDTSGVDEMANLKRARDALYALHTGLSYPPQMGYGWAIEGVQEE